jgi:hypothetical protein
MRAAHRRICAVLRASSLPAIPIPPLTASAAGANGPNAGATIAKPFAAVCMTFDVTTLLRDLRDSALTPPPIALPIVFQDVADFDAADRRSHHGATDLDSSDLRRVFLRSSCGVTSSTNVYDLPMRRVISHARALATAWQRRVIEHAASRAASNFCRSFIGDGPFSGTTHVRIKRAGNFFPVSAVPLARLSEARKCHRPASRSCRAALPSPPR